MPGYPLVEGKVALITGGGTGIGAACARRFAAEGAHVAVMGRTKEPLDRVAGEVGGLSLVGDASVAADARRAVETIVAQWGRLDILVANAGSFVAGSAADLSDEGWAQSLRGNLTSAFVCAREAIPRLIDSRGSIVVVSSIAGLVAGTEVCGYVTTKHALIGLTRSLARDLGPQGVRANAVCPGWVCTPMADDELQVLMDACNISVDDAYKLVTRDVPLGRPASAEEIAAVCLFLASPEASIITGAILPADGGSTIVDVPTLAFVPGAEVSGRPQDRGGLG
jgi:meso-butanediol dehydrogenase / (S,S)-butanediol dehydrogenase / diacetyl reductase